MINDKLFQEIKQYCELNEIDDIEKEINRLLRIGFNIEKYGVSPFAIKNEIVQKHLSEDDENQPLFEKQNIEETPKKKIRIIKN